MISKSLNGQENDSSDFEKSIAGMFTDITNNIQ
jgi:hypothetical protein